MQDRFKFRVWDETEKNMVYFDGIFYNKKPYTEGSSFPQYDSSPHYHKLSDLMQCTGLKDKNGKLIYEDDIVKFKTELFGKPKQIIWDECHYILKDTFIILCDTEIKQFGLEVIGNIYENPKLLEV